MIGTGMDAVDLRRCEPLGQTKDGQQVGVRRRHPLPELPGDESIQRLTDQLIKNSALMVVARISGIITLLVSVPFIIAYLGDEGYGVWESLLAIGTLPQVFQAVISSTILWQISVSHGKQENQEARRLVRIGIGCTQVLLLMLVPIVLVWRHEITSGLQLPLQWQSDAHWLLPWLVAVIILGGVNQSLLSVLNGYQRAGQAALIQSLGLMATNFTAMLVLILGGGLKGLLFGYLAGFAAMFVVLYPLASQICGGISLWPTCPTGRDLAALGPFAGLVLLSNAAFLFRDHTDKLLLASLASPLVVGYFVMAQRISALILQLCLVTLTPLTALIGSQYAQGRWSAVRQIYESTSIGLISVVGLIGFLVCTLHRPLMMLWLGHEQPQAYPFLAITVFGVVSSVTFAGPGVALAKGIGRPGYETVYSGVTLGLILISKPLLVVWFGASASVISSSLSWCLGSMMLLHLLHSRLDLPGSVLHKTYRIYLATVAVSTMGWWLASGIPHATTDRVTGLLILVLAGPLLTAVYLVVLALIGTLNAVRWRAVITRLLPGLSRCFEDYEPELTGISH